MANVKISQLPIATAVTGDDFVAMVDSGSLATQQVSFEKVLNYVTSSTFNTLTVTDLQGASADFTSLTGTLQGNASSATNATAVNTVFNNDNAVKYIPFVDTNGNQELKIDSGITYVPLSDSLIVNGNTTVAGNVGIGITSPGELLDVRNSSATVGEGARIGEAKIGTWEGSTSYAAFVHNSVHATANSYALLQSNLGETVLNTASGRTLFFKNNNNTNMIINSAGNVGIGTTNPGARLDVNLVSTAPAIRSRNGDGSATFTNPQIAFSFAGGSTYNHFVHTRHNSTGPAYNAIDFYVCDGTPTNSLTVGSIHTLTMEAGNVGIGTTSPNAKLEVVGDSIFSGSVEVSGTLRADVEVSGNITAASYTLSAADYGKTLLFSSSATQDITCSSGLDVGYNVTVIQAGTGQLNFSGSGVTLVNRFAHTSSAGQYSAVSVIVLNGTQYLVVGDTA